MTSTASRRQQSPNITNSRRDSRNSIRSQEVKFQSFKDINSASKALQDELSEAYDRNDSVGYPQSADDQLIAPSDFRPSFTNPYFCVIEDTASGEQYHPTVHYIFEDDEPDLLIAASVRTLGGREEYQPPLAEKSDKEAYEMSLLPETAPGLEERYIVLNMASDGHTVESAHSLSSNWQISNVDVSAAPTWDEDTTNTEDESLLVGIRGTDVLTNVDNDDKGGERLLQETLSKSNARPLSGIEILLESFERGQNAIDAVIGADSVAGSSVQTAHHPQDHGK